MRRKNKEVEEREDQKELRRQVRTFTQGQLSQGCWMRGTGETMGGDVRFHSTGGQRGPEISPILSREE